MIPKTISLRKYQICCNATELTCPKCGFHDHNTEDFKQQTFRFNCESYGVICNNCGWKESDNNPDKTGIIYTLFEI